MPRAAHWALSPHPLGLRRDTSPAMRLVALTLAAHLPSGPVHAAEMDVLSRLCGHSSHQTAELLDRLVTARTLASWHRDSDTGEVTWTPASRELRVFRTSARL
ncbi:hypothetical protein [Streptomyces sp. NPDC004286]|uniref:hypothetical protein n=1 Tax=Streptomyces sp. NPDC004286 TaxID=3364696 RepID=UPI0036C918C8